MEMIPLAITPVRWSAGSRANRQYRYRRVVLDLALRRLPK
jgi:hypothetical protein